MTKLEKAKQLCPQFFKDGKFVPPHSLLSIGVDAKTIKGKKYGYLTGIMYLIASNHSGLGNLCPCASKGCRAACLLTAGRGQQGNVREARMHRTVFYFIDRKGFMKQLISEIHFLVRKAKRENLIPAVRLNGTSDIQWEKIKVDSHENIFSIFPDVQFYDYTKIAKRFEHKLPANYQLTFSRSESNETIAEQILKSGNNVSVVFANSLPNKWKGHKVINGDKHDIRFNDGKKVVVGLTAKGYGRNDKSGFVVV